MIDRERPVAEALGERAKVLLGKDRSWNKNHYLLAVCAGLKRCPQGDLRLAVANVTADQAIHRTRRLHVSLDVFYGVSLIGGLGVRKATLEVTLPLAIRLEGVADATFALGVEVEQLTGQLLRSAARTALDLLPARAAELAQRRIIAGPSDIAGDLRQLIRGDEYPIVALILEIEVIASYSGNGFGVKASETGDTVTFVDNDVTGSEFGERT